MIDIPINYWAVIVAAIVNFILGYLWFGPVFGKAWMKASGMQKPAVIDEAMKKSMMRGYAGTFVGSLLMSYALSHFILFAAAYMGGSLMMSGLITAFWMWVGFILPVTVGVVFWDNKSWKYWTVTYTYYLVGLLAMAAILSSWI